MSRTAKAQLLLAAVTLIWGTTFVLVKDALNDVTPLFFNAVRMSAAAIALSCLYPANLARIRRPELAASLPVGFFLFSGYALQTLGLRLTTPSKSGFITGMSVVLVPMFLLVLFRRRLNFAAIFGVALAFVGLALLALPAGQHWRDLGAVNPGDWLTLGCAVAFAFHIIFLGRATEQVAFQAVAMLQTAVAAVLMWIAVLLFEHAHIVWSTRVITALVITSLLATAVAFAVQSWAQQFTPPTHAALIFSLEPVFAMAASVVFLHERLAPRPLLGCGLILSGVLIAELLPQRAAAIPPA